MFINYSRKTNEIQGLREINEIVTPFRNRTVNREIFFSFLLENSLIDFSGTGLNFWGEHCSFLPVSYAIKKKKFGWSVPFFTLWLRVFRKKAAHKT